MIGIDWVAVVVLGAAWIFSTIRAVPLAIRYWVFALACFGVGGYRLTRGAAGANLIFVLIAVILGIQYAIRALKVPKQQ